MHIFWRYLAVATIVVAVLANLGVASAAPIAQPAFERLWQRTGIPIQRGAADYSWVWGPEPFTQQLMEAYAQSPSGRRAVQYFDKSRMEITDPGGDPNSAWFVTNGLLVNELISGQVQIGANEFIPLGAAAIPIAGDPSNTFPTYASLVRIYNTPAGRALGDHVTSVFLPEGAGELPQYADSTATEIVRMERGFGIPRAFWDDMNRSGTVYQNGQLVPNQPILDWLFTLGYPTTEAFWTKVKVGGVEREVMFQAFERRLLTYTPSNSRQYQVEMGNVGQHYYQWRYEAPFAGDVEAVISVPERGAQVSSPLLVQGFGSGSAFEGAITVRLKDSASGTVLASVNTLVLQADVGKAGPFQATLNFTPPAQPTPATIEVITRSPRDGAEILLASREVIAAQGGLAEAPERIAFETGAISAQRSSLLPSGVGVKQYVLGGSANQMMTVDATSDGVPLAMTIESPAGNRWIPEMMPVAGGGYQIGRQLTLPETGDYLVTLTKGDHTPSTNYTITFTIQ